MERVPLNHSPFWIVIQKIIWLYAGKPEYPMIPKGNNSLVRIISRQPTLCWEPQRLYARVQFYIGQDIVRTLWRHRETDRNILSHNNVCNFIFCSSLFKNWKLSPYGRSPEGRKIGNYNFVMRNKIVDTLVVHALNDVY